MAILAGLHHLTWYQYDRPVVLGPQIVRLRPAPHSRTPVISHSLKVSPQPHFVNHQQDPYGNWLSRFVFPEPVKEFKIEVDLVADMTVYNPFDFFVEEAAEHYPFSYAEDIAPDLSIYLDKEPVGPKLKAFLKTIDVTGDPRTVDFLVALNMRLEQEITYEIRMEPGVQTPDETLKRKAGSCRDSSWLLVQILRNLGIAARFCSGYLIQLKPDLVSLDGPPGTDHDFTDLHAWCEAYIPGAGWIGLDPTSGLLTGESHIPLAATPHYRNAAPIAGGLTGNPQVEFSFDMQIKRLAEHPRITKPFSEEDWNDLDALGDKVDEILKDEDVRLTMGGEPTFVSIDDFESEQWNSDATGPHKRALADVLIRKLRDRFAPGGFLHYGQGKWYPGESLPRWTFSLYWRKDGEPIWRDDAYVAPEATDTGAGPEEAKLLLQGVAKELRVEMGGVQPTYEDPAEWIVKEAELPENVTPEDSQLDDPEERARIARVFSRGLTEPAGFVLPVQRWQAKAAPSRWRTEKWSTRRGQLFLIPGDSPVGFRLPLGSLPFIPSPWYPYIYTDDPNFAHSPLPKRRLQLPVRKKDPRGKAKDEKPERPEQPIASQRADAVSPQALIEQEIPPEGFAVRTAIAVEPRDGRLCVFMPPTESLEDYLELLEAIENSAIEQGLPIHLEGYAPPNDPRLNVIKVAPDPGVIEVNIHPATSWRDCVDTTTGLYEDARNSRLGADKFMIDGKHTGTGGGNHVVVGGATPMDSPFLRRPDMLKSLILHWQRHPSLSYLFSGLFVGPTSQAPRIDEARNDSLYELEIALSNIPLPGEGLTPQPWLVDRLLRNILIDVTGNTHRSEICIDKLYSPDGPTGRLGLVEFRAFEMPPDARMSLAQQLLMRALIARFWKSPATGNPVKWGTRLHDRFMLPDCVWQDFCDVLDDLNEHGFPMKKVWFEAQAEFRFPFCGQVEYDGVKLELRQAMEPWHVLGETGAIGGTVRYADSSVERLQVKLTGANEERHMVVCNGRQVPLYRGADNNSLIGAIRFKAWKPPMSMHPTLEVDAPLSIDIYDKWSRRGLGGCTYHVAHPGGRNYETFPVNANEAEARRLARFEAHGHIPAWYDPPEERIHPDFPMTLDMRRK